MTNHTTIDAANQPPPPSADATFVNEVASTDRQHVTAFWLLAGFLVPIAAGLMFSWQAFGAIGTCTTGDYCGLDELFNAFVAWCLGYLGGALTVSMFGRYVSTRANDGFYRSHYAQKGAAALPAMILVVGVAFLFLARTLN